MFKGSDNQKRIIVVFSIILFIFFVPLISSYDLKLPTNETACNITISFLNSTDLINNQEMSINMGYANYSFNPPTLGDYFYYSNCGYGIINPNGENLTTSKGILYFLVTLFAFSIFAILLYTFISIDGGNPRSQQTGDILNINYKKYFKASLFPLVYISFLWAFNFIIGLSNNYLGLTLYSNTLEFIFMVLIKLVYPIIIITVLVVFYLLVKDSNIKKEYQSLWSRY